MGNQTSQNNQLNELKDKDKLKPKSISQILDYISTYYIVTMDFKSLRKLYEKEYCDKLVILTSDIIQRYFTDLEITYLAQRVRNGVEVNENDKDNIIFFDRDMLSKLDIQNSIKKKSICNSIAKFYIKIAHLFAAIVTTINPIYVYKDTEGNTVRASLKDKGTIPKDVPREILKLNICDNRIKSLQNNGSGVPDENGNINVSPKFCTTNVDDNGDTKSLDDEPGIPELMELYLDDKYDFKTGTFNGMSEATQKLFNEDLKIFYSVFTGKQDMPESITKFSDIKLREYHKMPKCQGSKPAYSTKYSGTITNKLFNEYAENLKKMINNANKNQEVLLTIINELFVYTIDPQTGKKQIRVNPKLTENRLQELVVETRSFIIKLYLTCEMDYVSGLKIYEAIVEQKILETAQNQIDNLEKMSDKIIVEGEGSIPESAEEKELKKKDEENPTTIEVNKEEETKKEDV